MVKKKILIVDDSALMRRVESDIIRSDERFEVTDMAVNGLEAFDLVAAEKNGNTPRAELLGQRIQCTR